MGHSFIKLGKSFKIKPIENSPCSLACPLVTNVKAYVSLVAAGRFAEALEVVRRTNPFPGICGRVCPHVCEHECIRGEIDKPVAIAALKRFLADYELRCGAMPGLAGPVDKRTKKRAGSVAVIGAGPAGLTCAADLAREGYKVTVFEALSVAGGMMAFGIPPYRLPKDILRAEIVAIENMGVEIKLNTRIGDRLKFNDLTGKFDAVFIGIGAQRPARLGVSGEENIKSGIADWVSLLYKSAFGKAEKPGNRIVIVGGGNTAVDCARAAVRLGAEDVQILYRRSREEMPAFKEEVDDAEDEGVKINFLAAPVRLLAEKGKLTGVECVRMRLGKKDESGRRKPVPVENSKFIIPCDAVIPAIGQQVEAAFLGSKHKLKISKGNLLEVDKDTMATSMKGVFAGGDAVAGAASVVEAIAAGHRAAVSIDRYIKGQPLKDKKSALNEIDELTLEFSVPRRMSRNAGARLPAEQRKHSFAEVEQGFTKAQAVAEAERCLRCGFCTECEECVGVCEKKQVIIKPAGLNDARMLREPGMLVRVPQDVHRKIAGKGVISSKYKAKKHEISVFTSKVDEHLCRGCGLCEEICGYCAVRVLYRGDGVFTAQVNEDACRGCGACVAVCPTGAIDQNHFTAKRINQVTGRNLRSGKDRFPIVVFACRWSNVLKKMSGKLPVEVVGVMCTSRIISGDVLRAFENGAAGVLILGCADDACHYEFGSRAAGENIQRVANTMSLLGMNRSRLKVVKIPTGGDADPADMVKDFVREIKKING